MLALHQKNFDHIFLLSFVTKSCSEFCNSMDTKHQAHLSSTIFWSLLKFVFIKLVMLSNHLIFCHCLLFLPSIFPSIRIFSSESALRIQWPKYWSFSLSINPYNEYLGLISFTVTSLISLLSKGLSRVFSSTINQKHQFFGA